MKDAQKPDHVSLNTLVSYLRDGRFVIPDFQREFEWKPWDIRELMRSIFLDHAKKLPAPRQLDGSSQASALVLGLGVQQPAFRRCGVHQLSGLPRRESMVRRRHR
jgi:hypothetical protein